MLNPAYFDICGIVLIRTSDSKFPISFDMNFCFGAGENFWGYYDLHFRAAKEEFDVLYAPATGVSTGHSASTSFPAFSASHTMRHVHSQQTFTVLSYPSALFVCLPCDPVREK
jgi:hypothetical protein